MLLIISAKMAHSLWRYISFSAEYTAVSQPVNKPSRVDAKTFDKNDVQLISQQNWFGKYQPVAAQVKQPEPVPVAETRLNVVLRGIAFGARPGAVIEEGGKQQVYLQGETLGSHNAVIEEINRDHVMLRYQGKIERLSLAEEERSTVAVTNKKAVSDEAKQAVAEPAVSVPVEIDLSEFFKKWNPGANAYQLPGASEMSFEGGVSQSAYNTLASLDLPKPEQGPETINQVTEHKMSAE